MKVSQDYLKQIIKEETERVLEEEQIDEAWHDAVGAAVSSFNPFKGGKIGQAVGGWVQKARAASLDADTKRQMSELIKQIDAMNPKFQALVDRANKLFKGDKNQPLVKAITGIKTGIDQSRSNLQNLLNNPLGQSTSSDSPSQSQAQTAAPASTASPAQPAPAQPKPAQPAPAQPKQKNKKRRR